MKAILIDVQNKSVSEVETDGTLQSIYTLTKCDIITTIKVGKGEYLYIDDEGLLRNEPLGAFAIKGYPQILSGNGLILGTDEEGESIGTSLTAQQIAPLITFHDASELPEPKMDFYSFK